MRRLSLGLDTSNYTTSVALTDVDTGEILADERTLLDVRPGEKGLRQSDALFQHWNNLPRLLAKVLPLTQGTLACVAASERPRPQEGSYMPVFTAGVNAASMLASQAGVPLLRCSHQEGHLWAACAGKQELLGEETLLLAHLSGGTLELVFKRDDDYSVCGGTRDISYGQLLDRAGVDLGFAFPAGKSLDDLAVQYAPEGQKNPFSRVFRDKTYLNLSGLETQLKSLILSRTYTKEALAYFVMERIAQSFCAIADEAAAQTGAKTVLVTGGVACSAFLRSRCEGKGYVFGDKALCGDNAAGVSLFGGARCR